MRLLNIHGVGDARLDDYTRPAAGPKDVVIRMKACGSLSLFQGLPGKQNYAASKAGIAAAIRCMAVEFGKYNIRANVVAPGLIITPMMGGEQAAKYISDTYGPRTPIGRVGYPEDFEGIGAYLCSNASSFLTGETITIDGGYMVRP